jgi:lipoate-protein ligase A
LGLDEEHDKIDYKTINNDILINALDALGIKGEASGRNDIVVDGKKVNFYSIDSIGIWISIQT